MAEFTPINTMSVKTNVPTNEDGFIAQAGETVKGVKAISINGISVGANLAGVNAVHTAFLSIAGGSFDSLSTKRTMSGGVTA